MDVFQVHQQLLADYEAFTAGFTKIHDPRIRAHVEQRAANGDQWPDAYLSLAQPQLCLRRIDQRTGRAAVPAPGLRTDLPRR
ncbi:MAG: hypothetical protein ACRDTD_00425 [Pseudonocardiaceae bacterium]